MAGSRLMYALANSNSNEARRLYAKTFHNTCVPDKIFWRMHKSVAKTGSFVKETKRTPISVENLI